MIKNHSYLMLLFLFVFILLLSCSQENNFVPIEPAPISPVVFNIDSVPYQNLSEYHFFEGNIQDLNPVYGVLPYDLNSTLFTDYAKKKRFVWMYKDSLATYVNDYSPLHFPVGTVLIKNFYYENVLPDYRKKIIETRLMIKKQEAWTFANYVWNSEQTDATFTTSGSFDSFEWVENNETKSVNYRIPSFNECFTCHNKYDVVQPIGTKPQNLNRDYTYSEGSKNQLVKWVEQGYLDSNYPANIVSTVKWDDPSQPLDLRVRSYFEINCAHCHSNEGYCEYTSMRFEFNMSSDLQNLGVCVENDFYINDTITNIVYPKDVEQSALFFRLSSTLDQYKMPLLGTTLKHEEGIQLIEEWINSLMVCQ